MFIQNNFKKFQKTVDMLLIRATDNNQSVNNVKS